MDAESLLAIIRNCSQLRKVTLSLCDVILTRQDMITLLTTARCVTHFEYRQTHGELPRSAHTDAQQRIQNIQCNALTHLTWIADFDGFPYDLLPFCPNLETLILPGVIHASRAELETLLSSIILRQYLRLHTFAIGEREAHLLKRNHLEKDRSGLRHLTLAPQLRDTERISYLSHAAAMLYKEHQATLLSFTVDTPALKPHAFWTQFIGQLTAPVLPLTYLANDFHAQESQATAFEILFYRLSERCPHLDTLDLWHVPWNDHQLLRVLSSSDSLSRVTVRSTDLRPRPEVDDWLEGVSYTLPALTHLALHHYVHDAFYDHISRLENLKTLAISSQNHISPRTLTRFFTEKTPRLERVDVDGLYGAFNGKVAAALATIPSLRDVIIDDDASITEKELRVLFDHGKVIRQRLYTPLFPV